MESKFKCESPLLPIESAVLPITRKKIPRASLSAEKKHDLFSKITAAKQQPEYKLLEPTIQNLDDLDEAYQMHMMLKQTEIKFVTYDLTDVCKIVYPIQHQNGTMTGDLQMVCGSKRNSPLEAKFKDLLQDYGQLLTPKRWRILPNGIRDTVGLLQHHGSKRISFSSMIICRITSRTNS
jgi:hypothetical protein